MDPESSLLAEIVDETTDPMTTPVALPEITTPTPEPPSQVVTYAPVV
ncbi:unnamed protein product, partial [Allacma fusca]